MSEVKYNIYPSLLDKFQSYLDADMEAESFWNIDSETGEMKKSSEEIEAERMQELLDSINRVPHDPIEAADKGTCFNELVDCMNGASPDLDMLIEEEDAFVCGINGFEFRFDKGLVCEVAAMFKDSVPQYQCNGYIETRYGLVHLYGYADEIVRDKVYDIKTTSSYSFGKFERAWQKDVYPWCLVESDEIGIREFEYTVIQLTKPSSRNPVIGGKIYKEVYTYDHDAVTERLTMFIERFIEFLECHRSEITDKKIFGGINE